MGTAGQSLHYVADCTGCKVPPASGKTMKSGYGLDTYISAQVRSSAPSSQITGAQNVVAYFPEFNYSTYWYLLQRLWAIPDLMESLE